MRKDRGAVASQITIRPWAKRDRDAVQGLLSLLAPHALVGAGDAPTYVAEADDQVVGMVTVCLFTTLTGKKAYLDHLVVARNWRRRGVARHLMRHAIDIATTAGASRLDLTASDQGRCSNAVQVAWISRARDRQLSSAACAEQSPVN